MRKSRYGRTILDENSELLRYPFEGPIKYEQDYSATYSKYSIVDKSYIDSLVKPQKRLISGGAEWASEGSAMGFSLSDLIYTFAGEVKKISAHTPSVTFDQGDSLDRIDAIVINETGTITIVKGTPSSSPVNPSLSDSQILVQYATIKAGATSIGTSESIYTNNSQWAVSQYQLSGTTLSGTYNPDFSDDDFQSGKCIQLDSDYTTGIRLTRITGASSSLYGSISMRIKFTSAVSDQKCIFFQIQGETSGNTIGSNVINLMSYGLQRDIIGQWQHIIVPLSKMGRDFAVIKSITLRMAGGTIGENTLWRADYIMLQQGVAYNGYMGEPDSTGGTVLSGSGGSGGGATGVIGPAEDGNYQDGVFTDFNASTPIGTAIDRFNELLLALVPSKAPAISDWSGSRSNGVNAGRLSFDDSNPISGAQYSGANTAPSLPISVDGTWTAGGKRLGIFAAGTNDLSGILTNNITATTAYVANSFGDATDGTMTLNINGTIVPTATVNLSSTNGAINTTNSNTTSGFIISAATASKFPTGTYFEQFQNRTGSWVVKANDPRIRNGYNYIIAEHKSTSFTRTLSRIEFIQDDSTILTTFSSPSISIALSAPKFISGIQYYTSGAVTYDATINNLYRNTYYSGNDAITFIDASASGIAGTNPILDVSRQYQLLASGGNELKIITLSSDYPGTHVPFNIISSGKRRLNDPISISLSAKRTIQGTLTSSPSTISNVYLDNVAASSNISTAEGFDDETYRLKSNVAYDLITDVSSGSNAWVSSQSLTTGSVGHNDGLQVYNSMLIYPKTDFSTPGSLTSNPNFGNSDRNYSTATGNRTYYRYFQFTQVYTNYRIVITGSGGTFVPKTTALTGNNIWVEMKLPSATGWLDCWSPFSTGAWADGNGAYASNYGNARTLNGNWGLTTGARGNFNSGGYIVFRITTASSFTGQLTGMTLTWI
jgi:hypothetical protein